MTDKTTMHQLEIDLIDELNNNKKEILERKYPSDVIHEYVDGWIPVYNYDLLRLACDDLWLGYKTEEQEEMKAENSYDIIKWNIYEKLSEIAYKWLSDNEKKEVA